MKLASTAIDTWLKKVPENLRFILVYGQDEGQISMLTSKLSKNFMDDPEEDMNLTHFEFKQIKEDPGLLADEMASVSLLGGRRVIVINNCGAALPKALVELTKNPKGDAIVIFSAGELKPSSSLRKTFEAADNAVAIPCYKDDPAKLQQFIRGYLIEQKATFEQNVPALLAELLPSNKLLIAGELDKLILYKGDEGQINDEDIINVVAEGSELSLDDLCVSVANKDTKGIQKNISRIEQEGTSFMLVLRVLLKYFMRIIEVKAEVDCGKSVDAAVSALRPPVFFKQKDNLIRTVRQMPLARAKTVLKSLVKLEAECKNTIVKPELLVNNFLTHVK